MDSKHEWNEKDNLIQLPDFILRFSEVKRLVCVDTQLVSGTGSLPTAGPASFSHAVWMWGVSLLILLKLQAYQEAK